MKNLLMIRTHSIVLVACGLLQIGARAQDLEGVATAASNDLQKALAELSAARSEIEAQRLPLARQVTELEQKLADRKTELAKAQRFQENQLVELNALKTEARRQADEVKFI